MTPSTMSRENPWSNPDRLPPVDAQALARFIDERATRPDQRQAHDALLAALAPQAGERLLDLGCGSGVLTRRLAAQVGPSGEVVGVDISRAMLDYARQQTAADQVSPAPRYEQADATSLPFPDGYFHGALMARTLMHVPDPQAVLTELRRVMMPGGRLAILEADWGTVAVDHSRRELTRRILAWRTDHVDGNNWMGRQLVRRCLEAGWQVRTVQGLVSIGRNEETTHFGSLRRCAALALEQGVITQAEHDAWVAELDERLAAGLFFASINEYIVVVTA